MRNPNRYGSVTKLLGNRRKPWMIREGISGCQKPIGYAATREEALLMLADFNNNPWDIDQKRITFSQLYQLWLQKRAVKLGRSNYMSMKSAYRHCKKLEKLKYAEIKSFQMQECIDSCGKSYATQGSIKNLFSHLDRFAMEMDIIQKKYSELLTSAPVPLSEKRMFSDAEIKIIWKKKNLPWMDSVLFLLYTGFRISEMLALKTENIDLNAGTIIGGTKTAAGKNRIVPIHSKIKNIVASRLDSSVGGYLFEYNGNSINQCWFRRNIWEELMKKLKMNHTPHECRHTLRSWLDSAGANKVCIDRIIGHQSAGTGERIYTHKSIEELKHNIELVTN